VSDAPATDADLLAAHVAGDPEAFGLLFARHRERLWAVALRTCGDREEAADALQDALVSAFRRADGYRGDSSVTTWLHRIVVNACLDRRRRAVVRRAQPLPEEDEDVAPNRAVSAAGTDPADEVERAERAQAVHEALRTLPVEQRAALVLVDMQGFSVDEAAAILEVPAGTVKSRCSRGRAKLAPLLGLFVESAGNPADPPRVPSEEAERGGERP
jgi:RNA polymerase sigma-70 factor (ECF subfamily)